jgi:phasin family protein
MASDSDPAHGRRASDTDFTKFFSEVRLPPIPDLEGLLAAQRKNLEALAAANRVALDGAQAFARRHMEIMQASVAELTETLNSFASTAPPQELAARQAELIKRSYERAVANIKELSELVQKSNGEALQTLNRRFAEAIEEVRQFVTKSGPR